jgi:hypothetical protein
MDELVMHEYAPWVALALLGAFHGVNPGMGWLFAVALGLQEKSRAAVLRAFGPIALGHAASVAGVVALVAAVQVWIDAGVLRALVAVALVAFGLYKLLAPMSHPRWVGMRVGARDLAVWSFLMATAHGAGLMLVPVLLGMPTVEAHAGPHAGQHEHADHALMTSTPGMLTGAEVAAVAIHTAAMYVAMGAIAVVVFENVGLAVLRRAWFNLDRVWAGALIVAGTLTLAF